MSNPTEQQTSNLSSSSSSSSLSVSNSISLIKLDELSPFGAYRQSRLPTLIKLNQDLSTKADSIRQSNSMPTYTAEELEKQASASVEKLQTSLPVQQTSQLTEENQERTNKENQTAPGSLTVDDFQIVEMSRDASEPQLVGPSLPATKTSALGSNQQINQQHLNSSQQLQSSQLGDSLIDMIINLKNENQSLVRALEANNEYVKDRLSEFKRVQDEAKRREIQFAQDKAEHEHQMRKLQRQNSVLSERLKSMESKLKEMKLEVAESLDAARSSKASSIAQPVTGAELYPSLEEPGSFGRIDTGYHQEPTLPVSSEKPEHSGSQEAPMDTSSANEQGAQTGVRLSDLSKEELSKRFDASKADFYALSGDPLRQCDKLEQQLNDIGKRDYEICLLQQQLNIYRQDFRLERMANLEAKLQIEKLKNDIDRLCLNRLTEKHCMSPLTATGAGHPTPSTAGAAAAAADAVLGRLGHQLGKKAAKSAAKAAKYAAKQAHREERAAAVAAAKAAAVAASATSAPLPSDGHGRHHRHHHHRHLSSTGQLKKEVVSDLLSTANRAMLTGYKMASTHVNLALDKLSQFEQSQASKLADSQAQPAAQTSVKVVSPSAPVMDPPSID